MSPPSRRAPPAEMGAAEVTAFFTSLALDEQVAPATRNQARSDPGVCVIVSSGERLGTAQDGNQFARLVQRWESPDPAHVFARHLRVGHREVIAIGDEKNDVPMLQWAGLGLAMGNAPR